jgi:hypothetical protein
MNMPKYTVQVNRTQTIESSVDIEVSAKDESSAQKKIETRIAKLLEKDNLASLDWEGSFDDSFEYEVN